MTGCFYCVLAKAHFKNWHRPNFHVLKINVKCTFATFWVDVEKNPDLIQKNWLYILNQRPRVSKETHHLIMYVLMTLKKARSVIKGGSDCKRALFRTNASTTSTTRQYTTRTSAPSTTSYSTPSEASSDVDGSPYEVPSAHCATRGPVCSRSPRRVFETTPAMALCSKTSSVYQISEKKIIQQSTRRS